MNVRRVHNGRSLRRGGLRIAEHVQLRPVPDHVLRETTHVAKGPRTATMLPTSALLAAATNHPESPLKSRGAPYSQSIVAQCIIERPPSEDSKHVRPGHDDLRRLCPAVRP